MADEYKVDSEQLDKLLHSAGVVDKITGIANQLCAAANQMASQVVRPSQQDKDNFGVYVAAAGGTRARAYVHPLGLTGIHIEAGNSVLLKAISTVMGGSG